MASSMGRIEIRRVDLLSLFKLAFVLYAALGVVAGLFYGLIIMVIGQLGSFLGDEDLPGLKYFTGLIGVLAVPVLAVLYGILGSVVVTIGGALYNLAARMVGGLKLETASDTPLEARPIANSPAPPAV